MSNGNVENLNRDEEKSFFSLLGVAVTKPDFKDLGANLSIVFIGVFIVVLIIQFCVKLDNPDLRYLLENVGLVASLIFGISSSLLTLIGLVAIFVTLNSQQNVYKCRELIWQLIDIPEKLYTGIITRDDECEDIDRDSKGFEQVKSIYRLYEHIMKPDSDFTNEIIKLAKNVIRLVIILWISLGYLMRYNNQVSNSDFYFYIIGMLAGTFILLSFIILLGKLTRTAEIGKIPTFEQLTDLSLKPNRIKIGLIAAATLKATVSRRYNNVINIGIMMPTQFHDFSISVSLTNANDALYYVHSDNVVFVRGEMPDPPWYLKEDVYKYSLMQFELDQNVNQYELTFTVLCKKYECRIEYGHFYSEVCSKESKIFSPIAIYYDEADYGNDYNIKEHGLSLKNHNVEENLYKLELDGGNSA